MEWQHFVFYGQQLVLFVLEMRLIMIKQLKELLINGQLYDKLQRPEEWDSLIINRRKPYTYRVFTMIGTLRVCLHRFDECSNTESFIHPHAWPAAFTVLRGLGADMK